MSMLGSGKENFKIQGEQFLLFSTILLNRIKECKPQVIRHELNQLGYLCVFEVLILTPWATVLSCET